MRCAKHWECDDYDMAECILDEPPCFKVEQSPQAEQATASCLSDLLCAAKVKKEKTPSGWEQPYVEIRILNFDFKRIYHTEDAATRCAEKINKLLANGT